jgi:hypothetical protein
MQKELPPVKLVCKSYIGQVKRRRDCIKVKEHMYVYVNLNMAAFGYHLYYLSLLSVFVK